MNILPMFLDGVTFLEGVVSVILRVCVGHCFNRYYLIFE